MKLNYSLLMIEHTYIYMSGQKESMYDKVGLMYSTIYIGNNKCICSHKKHLYCYDIHYPHQINYFKLNVCNRIPRLLYDNKTIFMNGYDEGHSVIRVWTFK